jgi:hypothetical protein
MRNSDSRGFAAWRLGRTNAPRWAENAKSLAARVFQGRVSSRERPREFSNAQLQPAFMRELALVLAKGIRGTRELTRSPAAPKPLLRLGFTGFCDLACALVRPKGGAAHCFSTRNPCLSRCYTLSQLFIDHKPIVYMVLHIEFNRRRHV